MTQRKKQKTWRQAYEEEKNAAYHLLISIDPTLLGCIFMYIHRGTLPVMYPLEALTGADTYHAAFDGSRGCTAMPLKNEAVKASFDEKVILQAVREFIEHVAEETGARHRRLP